ncbi:DUF3626 domain-containing protein [Paenibacillaceae bacterium]|nr:DUF3626 domain-containing protein [Paenibacillaceae bacterium]
MGRNLTTAQLQALRHVQANALQKGDRSRAAVEGALIRRGLPPAWREFLLNGIRANGQVTLNFHPDRLLADGFTVVEKLLQDGVYCSQFVTGLSNGSRTAFPGGDRDRWEQSLFGGAYQQAGVGAAERPKYGGLNLMNYADGAAPRFGSCWFRLHPHLLQSCTFTFGDSHTGPEPVGTIDAFDNVLAALLEAEGDGGGVDWYGLGEHDRGDSVDRGGIGEHDRGDSVDRGGIGEHDRGDSVDPGSFVRHLHMLHESWQEPGGIVGRALDNYIEAQVHGEIDLSEDVESLVADPSFKGTRIGAQLEALCSKYNVTLVWHAGFRLAVSSVPDDFRGAAMPPLAKRLDRLFTVSPGVLDVAVIGRAAASLQLHPEQWQDWGTPDETSQHLKQLWHVLVQYGRP